jgi:hypothetical protein
MIKVLIPGDYHWVFQQAVEISLLIEQGKPSTAFSLISFSQEARASTVLWSMPFSARASFLRKVEDALSALPYAPDSEVVDALTCLRGEVADLEKTGFMTITDRCAVVLHESLEAFCRLSMGQISDTMQNLTYGGRAALFDPQSKRDIEELRHQAVVFSGESFGISSLLISDDARNAWIARKTIQQHLAYKRKPSGGVTNDFDGPIRIGRCTPQNITIEDPEFSIQMPR